MCMYMFLPYMGRMHKRLYKDRFGIVGDIHRLYRNIYGGRKFTQNRFRCYKEETKKMTNKRIKIHGFPLGISPRMVWIAITKENKFDGFDELTEIDTNTDSVTEVANDNINNKGGVFIRFASKKAMTTDVIAHESCHAAMEIIDYIGGKIDLQNQEYFCYLVGYIAKCCQQVKNNKFED